MDDLVTTAVQVTVIGGAIWSIVSYVILKPLDKSIGRLEKSLDIMTVKLDEANRRSHDIEIKLAAVEQSAMQAHKRLDFLVKFCRQTHNDFPDKDR
ncbi:hypothetical protein [Selenomonas sp. AE3005]|uniref:hypothetical protein n=1 Tax=Selenomonas sp. AE3005 TaxID=1485543 RepID=UPI0025D0A3D9|nr:hypothetical protein [Selenomonas sp. AE3005]